jgi:hypothetical protein
MKWAMLRLYNVFNEVKENEMGRACRIARGKEMTRKIILRLTLER